jgi:hypothetical protein
MSQGMTPLLKAELAHSKVELENILGPMGSANRMLISSRSGTLGTDFVPTWCVFVFFLYRLIPRFRPASALARSNPPLLARMTHLKA